MNGMNPSYTRMGEGDHAHAMKRFEATEDWPVAQKLLY
jgi:hypothetical protein